MRKLASLLPDRVKLALLKRHLARSSGGAGPMLALLDQPEARSPLQVLLRKCEFGIEVGLDLAAAMNQRFVYHMLYARLPTVLRIFSRSGPNVRMVAADLSDGSDPPVRALAFSPCRLAFCSCRDNVILVPDPVFVNSDGYAEFRGLRSVLPWSRRRDTVLWRGSSTGIGEVTTDTMRADDPRLRQRVRMCLILHSTTGADVKIRKIEGGASPIDRDRLVRFGLLGRKIRQAEWGRYKFALDVDGHSNAWSNFFVRLLLGCCVLKIQSQHGFRQWYYDRLKPWRHYVPVRADMSDLVEKIDWCWSHDAECAEIASVGQAFAHAMTVDSEIAEAVRQLEAAESCGLAVAAGAP
jgi:hypothetical protein